VEVDAPSAEPEESGTWVPATGGSLTLCFLGQPASSVAAAMSKAIDTIRFIYSLHPGSFSDPLFCKGTGDELLCVIF
jgi:CBS-domain-containing membrane protein